MSLINVESNEQFYQIVENNPNVLMEFYATWCPHCHAFQPVLEQASALLNEKGIYTAQTEIDTFEQLASEFGVESIPTLIFFKNGQPVAKTTGERDEQAVYEFVEEALQQ